MQFCPSARPLAVFGWDAVDDDDVVDAEDGDGCVIAADAVLHDIVPKLLIWIGREPVNDVIEFIAGFIAEYGVVELDGCVSREVRFEGRRRVVVVGIHSHTREDLAFYEINE